MKTINNSKIFTLSFMACAVLTACGGGDSNVQASTPVLLAGSQTGGGASHGQTPAPLSCAELPGTLIPANVIALNTTGGVVSSATEIPASTQQSYTVGAYCKVFGKINPVDPLAPPINFQLNLPLDWNRKAMMFGGGGYNGVLSTFPSGLNNTLISAATHPSPLARGYATFGSDSGHILQPPFIFGRDASFAVNDEALINYAGDALKKTHDAAKYLINLHYRKSVKKTYFQGGSTGGREGLAVIQRWPADFDGVISLFPAWNAASFTLQAGRIGRALAQPGAYLNVAKRTLLFNASVAGCDAYDGVQDGIVSNVAACNAQFDPMTATVDGTPGGTPLRCAGGVDLGDFCLSDAQLGALQVMATPAVFSPPLASGETGYPGLNVWGTDFGMPSSNPDLALSIITGWNVEQPAYPVNPNMPYLAIYYDQWMKYFVTRDASFNGLAVDPENPGVWRARVDALSVIQDDNNTDLSPFAQKGGKLLLIHGQADALVSSHASANYFTRLQQTMGENKVKKFARYYEIPGYGHAVSPNFNATVDVVTILEKWAEDGKKPKKLEVVDKTGVIGRSRPLCEFPGWPKYKGNGDVNLAQNFKCVKSDNQGSNHEEVIEGDEEDDEDNE